MLRSTKEENQVAGVVNRTSRALSNISIAQDRFLKGFQELTSEEQEDVIADLEVGLAKATSSLEPEEARIMTEITMGPLRRVRPDLEPDEIQL